MKKVSIIGTYILGITLFLASCTPKNNTQVSAQSTAPAIAGQTKIAWVNIDSLEEHYNYLKTKKSEFKTRQGQMEGELQRSYQQMQADAAEVQKKIQANSISQTEYDAANKRLSQMQQSLETRRQALTDQLQKEQEDFNKDLKSRLDAYMEEYNKDKHYDYILSYSSIGSSTILYANKALDITNEIIKGMNEESKDANAAKTTK